MNSSKCQRFTTFKFYFILNISKRKKKKSQNLKDKENLKNIKKKKVSFNLKNEI